MPTPIYSSSKSTGRKTAIRGVRLYETQLQKLNSPEYSGNASVLVRLLLEEFFADRIPSVKMKFHKLLNDSESKT
jgi:hypothetical protein